MLPRIPRLVFILAISAAYFSLAILGRGGFTIFFAVPALGGLAVVTALLVVVSLFAGGNLSPGMREDRSNRWVLAALALIALASGYLPAYCDRIDFWTVGGENIRWLGVGLNAVGGALRIWPVFVLGRRFSGLVAIQPGHELVTDGMYRFIRNPSYLGLLVSSLGWSLAFRSGAGIALTALIAPVLHARIQAEERLLLDQFGDAYQSYRARTWRLIPFLY